MTHASLPGNSQQQIPVASKSPTEILALPGSDSVGWGPQPDMITEPKAPHATTKSHPSWKTGCTWSGSQMLPLSYWNPYCELMLSSTVGSMILTQSSQIYPQKRPRIGAVWPLNIPQGHGFGMVNSVMVIRPTHGKILKGSVAMSIGLQFQLGSVWVEMGWGKPWWNSWYLSMKLEVSGPSDQLMPLQHIKTVLNLYSTV